MHIWAFLGKALPVRRVFPLVSLVLRKCQWMSVVCPGHQTLLSGISPSHPLMVPPLRICLGGREKDLALLMPRLHLAVLQATEHLAQKGIKQILNTPKQVRDWVVAFNNLYVQ